MGMALAGRWRNPAVPNGGKPVGPSRPSNAETIEAEVVGTVESEGSKWPTEDKNLNGTICVPKDLCEFFLDALYLLKQNKILTFCCIFRSQYDKEVGSLLNALRIWHCVCTLTMINYFLWGTNVFFFL